MRYKEESHVRIAQGPYLLQTLRLISLRWIWRKQPKKLLTSSFIFIKTSNSGPSLRP